MDLNTYQKLSQRTAMYQDTNKALIVAALGLGGESGEVLDHIKKYYGHGHELDIDYLKKELGDILWYVAYMAEVLGLDLEDVAKCNIDKLTKRYPEGFSNEASKNRSV